MPLYEFLCQKCGHDFEELCSLSTAMDMHCSKCGQPARKCISSFAFKSGTSFQSSSSGGHGNCSTCSSGNCAGCGH